MNSFKKKILQLTIVAGCLLGGAIFCNATVYLETWDSGNAGWQIKSEFEGAATGSITNEGGYLSINVSPGSPVLTDIIFADSSADGTLIETHTSTQAIQFTFYANMDPTYLYAYVKGTDSGGSLWLNQLSSVAAGGKSIGLDYDSGNGWYNMLAASTLTGWQNTLTSFDEVGIAIWYPGDAGQEYGIDNFTIVDSIIPEPETWLMLGFALLSITITFRRQINEAVVKV